MESIGGGRRGEEGREKGGERKIKGRGGWGLKRRKGDRMRRGKGKVKLGIYYKVFQNFKKIFDR